mmetsp:Transcript_2537/g.7619  ORF Transcript_2537/g.7619 Transcript_2537/m.7619 type:complete len:233 (-) Transcript_2537:1806-2504(-)
MHAFQSPSIGRTALDNLSFLVWVDLHIRSDTEACQHESDHGHGQLGGPRSDVRRVVAAAGSSRPQAPRARDGWGAMRGMPPGSLHMAVSARGRGSGGGACRAVCVAGPQTAPPLAACCRQVRFSSNASGGAAGSHHAEQSHPVGCRLRRRCRCCGRRRGSQPPPRRVQGRVRTRAAGFRQRDRDDPGVRDGTHPALHLVVEPPVRGARRSGSPGSSSRLCGCRPFRCVLRRH